MELHKGKLKVIFDHCRIGALSALVAVTVLPYNSYGQAVISNSGATISVTRDAVVSSIDTMQNSAAAHVLNNGAIQTRVLNNYGELRGNGVYSITATLNNAGTFYKDSGTVSYCGASQAVLGPANGISYFNLNLSGSGVKTFPPDTTRIAGLFTKSGVTADAVSNSSTIEYNGIDQTVKAITYYNLYLNNGGTKAFEYGTTQLKNLLAMGGGVAVDAVSNLSTINYSGTVPQTVKALNYYNLALSSSAMRTFEAGTTRIAGTLSSSAAVADACMNLSTIEFNGSGAQTIPAITFYNLASSSTGARTLPAGTINVKNNFVPGTNTYSVSATNTMAFCGTSGQTIPAFAYSGLTINNTHNAVLGGNISVAKIFTVSSYDSLNMGNYTATGGSLSSFKLLANSALYVPNDNFPTDFGSYTLTGLVNYNGADTETIYPTTYANLISSGTGNRVLPAGDTIYLSGTFVPGSNSYTATGSIVNFNGTTSSQTLPPLASSAYHHLLVSNRGKTTLSGNVAVTGDVAITNVSPFEMLGYSLTRATTGGSLILDSACTLYLGGSFPANFGTYVLNGTVNFNGTAAQTIPALNYYTLTSSSTGTRTLDSNGTIYVRGTFSGGSNSYTVDGSTINFSGTGSQTIPVFNFYNLTSSSTGNRTLGGGSIGVKNTFTPGSNSYAVLTNNTVVFNGTHQQTIPGFGYNSLTLNNTHNAVLGGNAAVAKTLTITDYDTLNMAAYTLTGTTAGNFTLPAHAALYVPADNFPAGFNAYTLNGLVNYNGSGTETIYPATYANLMSSGTGNRILPSGATVLLSGTFNPGSNSYTTTGNTVNFNGTVLQTLPPLASSSYNNLVVSNRGKTTLSGNVTANGDVAVSNLSPFETLGYTLSRTSLGGTFSVDSACILYVGGSFPANFGTYVLNGTVNFNGTAAQTIPALNYYTLTSSSTGTRTLDSNGTIYVRGTFSGGSNSYTVDGSTINFSGTGLQAIPVFNFYNLTSSSTGNRMLGGGSIGVKNTFTPGSNSYTVPTNNTIVFNGTHQQTIPGFGYNSLTLNNTHNAVLGGNVAVAKTLTITDYDTLNMAAYALTGTTAGNFTLPAHAALYVPTDNFPVGFNAYTLNGLVNYNGSGTETIYPTTYANLTSSGTGNRILPSGATVLLSGTFNPGSNSYTTTGNTVNFNGTVLQTLPPLASSSYNNLVVSNRGKTTLSGNVTVNGDVAVSNLSPFETLGYTLSRTSSGGTFSVDSACILYVGGSFPANFGAYVLNGTVNFNGTTPQTIPALNYYNLTGSSTGTRTLDNSNTIFVRGSFTPGTNAYAVTGSTVNFSGTAAQSIPVFAFDNLVLSNNATLNLTGNVTVQNNFALNCGQVTTTTHYFNVTNSSPGAITRTSGYINGKINRATAATGAYLFPVGMPGSYRPVTIAPTSGANNTFSVEFKNNNPTVNNYYTDSVLPGIIGINNGYYWKIARTAGYDSATIQLNTGATGTDYTGAPIPAFWNGTKWKSMPGVVDTANHTITLANVKAYGPFNFGYSAPAAKDSREDNGTFAVAEVSVYPNPVVNELNMDIKMVKDGQIAVSVFSVTGATVGQYTAPGHAGNQLMQINPAEWPTGVYVYRIQVAGQELTGKFLKK